MRTFAALIALGLCACGDARETRLESIDFTDPRSIQRVSEKLQPKDRDAWSYYVTKRIISGGFGGLGLTRPDGNPPATIAEAIEIGRADKALTDRRVALMTERNKVVARHNALLGDNGLPEKNKAEWDRLERLMADYDKKIEALGPTGGASALIDRPSRDGMRVLRAESL